jgi:hypothetical protein
MILVLASTLPSIGVNDLGNICSRTVAGKSDETMADECIASDLTSYLRSTYQSYIKNTPDVKEKIKIPNTKKNVASVDVKSDFMIGRIEMNSMETAACVDWYPIVHRISDGKVLQLDNAISDTKIDILSNYVRKRKHVCFRKNFLLIFHASLK